MAIDTSKVKWDSAPDPRMVKWDDEKSRLQQYKEAIASPRFKQELLTSLPGGLARGLKDVIDTGAWALSALGGQSDKVDALNKAGKAEFEQAQKDVGAGGSDVTRFLGNVAATFPVGGLLAKGVGAIPGASTKAAPLIDALRTSGMSAGGMTGVKSLPIRALTGGTVGGIAGAAVNPEDVGMAAGIGAVAPALGMAAGSAGHYLGRRSANNAIEAAAKFERSAPLRETVGKAVDAGYIIPPNMVNPSFKNALVESVSGKQATSQLASVRNQDVTEKLTRASLGLPDDAPLTKGALDKLRTTAGKTYAEVADLSPMAKYDLELLKQARNDAQGWFKAYNRSASPEDLAKAKSFREVASSLENALEGYAEQAGREDLIPALREARKQIAKTYTVERALNDASGTVNAKVFGSLYDKGKPLSDGLDDIGRFASAFPKINQSAQQIGSPAAHNLKAVSSVGLGLLGAGAGGWPGVAAAALPYAGGAAARSIMFRKGAQEALANQSAPSGEYIGLLADFMSNPQAQIMFNRGAPVIAAQ